MLDECSLNSIIGFGSIMVQRRCVVGQYAPIGNYAVIVSAYIGAGYEIGSRVSVTSVKNQRMLTDD